MFVLGLGFGCPSYPRVDTRPGSPSSIFFRAWTGRGLWYFLRNTRYFDKYTRMRLVSRDEDGNKHVEEMQDRWVFNTYILKRISLFQRPSSGFPTCVRGSLHQSKGTIIGTLDKFLLHWWSYWSTVSRQFHGLWDISGENEPALKAVTEIETCSPPKKLRRLGNWVGSFFAGLVVIQWKKFCVVGVRSLHVKRN